MKRRFVVLTTVLALSAGVIAGCGNSQDTSGTAETNAQTEQAQEAVEVTDASGEEKEQTVGLANPWVDITEEQAKENCLRLFKAPDGAQVQGWSMCEDLGDPDKGIMPLVQLSFMLDDMNFTARAQQGAAEDTDIAGNYVEWTVGPEEVNLANWGWTGKTYRSVNDTGYVDMITWYDQEIGISYSLSVAAKDLDGFDIQAVAEQMYAVENEPYANMPDDFLQEQSGITSFASYDEVIAQLQPGQGYAYIKLVGSDKEVLAVTDLVFEADHSAYFASIYNMEDGQAKSMGVVTGNGSAYPLRLADGILYAGDNHTYETYFLSQEYGSLMMKDMISDGVSTGSNELSGFTREKNSFEEEAADFTGTEEDLQKLLAERETKPIVEFTVIQ